MTAHPIPHDPQALQASPPPPGMVWDPNRGLWWDSNRGLWWDSTVGQWVYPQTVPTPGPLVSRRRERLVGAFHAGPAATAHGIGYWLLVGWWWGPAKYCGRMMLWLVLLPVGVWRSLEKARQTDRLRARRGWRKASRVARRAG